MEKDEGLVEASSSEIINKELPVQKIDVSADMQCFQNPFALMVCGPTMCGKSTFIYNILQNADKLLTTKYSRIVYYLPASDLYSVKRQAFIRLLRALIPRIEIETGLPKPGDCKSSSLPKLFIIGKQK
jgi:pantothenate kinase-related protein Tda10